MVLFPRSSLLDDVVGTKLKEHPRGGAWRGGTCVFMRSGTDSSFRDKRWLRLLRHYLKWLFFFFEENTILEIRGRLTLNIVFFIDGEE